MKIFDPVTGDALKVFGFDHRTQEVYGCTEAKVIATVRSHFRCDETEAIRKLANSDIDHPVLIDNEEFWVE